MPTVIALDVSLSMSRPVPMPDCAEDYQRKHLAIHGIHTLLDFMSTNCKLELTSLLVFSYLWEHVSTFTRDFESIKTALNKVEEFNTTCIETGLNGISQVTNDEWSSATPCQAILVTDGSAGFGQRSLKHSLDTYKMRDSNNSEEKFPLPFPFNCKLHVVIVGNPNDPEVKTSLPLFEQLIEINGQGGELFIPDGALSLKSVQAMFQRLGEQFYSPYYGMLKCGNLQSHVQLFPAPESCFSQETNETLHVESMLEILGFLDIADVSSPQTLSRHLVLPYSKDKMKVEESSKEVKKEDDDDGEVEEGKIPAFTVLLHGSLKVEGMMALTRIAENWYGLLYSWADSKKKSNLMISVLEPGNTPISWLGNISNLAPISDFVDPPFGEDDNKTPFPVKPQEKRSYAQSCVVWIKPAGLQTDLQKVLRHAKKLPEKQQQFYKELNRLRKAALAFGFNELLSAMAEMLERECTLLPGTAHPDAALQLNHAYNALRSEAALDISQLITPLQTNFSQDD